MKAPFFLQDVCITQPCWQAGSLQCQLFLCQAADGIVPVNCILEGEHLMLITHGYSPSWK